MASMDALLSTDRVTCFITIAGSLIIGAVLVLNDVFITPKLDQGIAVNIPNVGRYTF